MTTIFHNRTQNLIPQAREIAIGAFCLRMADEFEKQEESAELRIKTAREAASKKDILNWGRAMFPDKYELPFCHELHDYFVSIRGEEKTNTEAPRNHAKTTIKCNLIPIFQALAEPASFRHYLNVQATDKKALAVNVAIRNEIEHNQEIRAIYGNQIGIEKWTDQQFVLANGVIFTAVSAGQSIRGINYLNIRPDYIIVDDLYDEEDINNPDSTIKKNNWFWGSLYPARAKTRRCSIHVQGTAINPEDLLEELKKKTRWKSKTFRAVKDWDKKEVLWPELNTFESLEQDRADMGSVIFFRELQNERRDEASAIIKRSWLAGWEYDPDTLRFDKDVKLVSVSLKIDPSVGSKAENDYTAMVLMIKTKQEDSEGNHFWIENVWRQHLSMDERIKLVARIAADRPKVAPLTRVPIEAIGAFQDFSSELKRKTNLPIKEIKQVKDKLSVLETRSHYFENKKVHISKNIPQELRDVLIYELTTNHPKHDDLRDATLLDMEEAPGLDWI